MSVVWCVLSCVVYVSYVLLSWVRVLYVCGTYVLFRVHAPICLHMKNVSRRSGIQLGLRRDVEEFLPISGSGVSVGVNAFVRRLQVDPLETRGRLRSCMGCLSRMAAAHTCEHGHKMASRKSRSNWVCVLHHASSLTQVLA